MRRFFVSCLLAAVAATGLFAPSSAPAAVATYTYTVTGGTSSGSLGIGIITGGGFQVRFNTSPCFGCYDVSLLSGFLTGSLGSRTLFPSLLGAINPGIGYDQASPIVRSAQWIGTGVVPPAGGSQAFVGAFTHYTGYSANGLFNLQWRGGPLGTFVSGDFRFKAQEVAVPEPSAAALLAAGGVMLGASVLRRACRSLS
jgi:hypothetical protein